ncbi:hypothetical protein FIBSPDRAFT_850932, partial [Athelia psychrophila]
MHATQRARRHSRHARMPALSPHAPNSHTRPSPRAAYTAIHTDLNARPPAPKPTAAMPEDPVLSPAAHYPCQHHHEDCRRAAI